MNLDPRAEVFRLAVDQQFPNPLASELLYTLSFNDLQELCFCGLQSSVFTILELQSENILKHQ